MSASPFAQPYSSPSFVQANPNPSGPVLRGTLRERFATTCAFLLHVSQACDTLRAPRRDQPEFRRYRAWYAAC